MTETAGLIERLVADCRPVGHLRPAWQRALGWLAIAALVVASVAGAYGGQPDLTLPLSRPDTALALLAALLTGVLAAFATFHLSLPDRSPAWALLPLPPLALWLLSLGWGCLVDLLGPAGLALGRSIDCFQAILIASLPLGLILLVMVRHAGTVRPGPTALTGALAVSALASAGVTLFHDQDTALMVLLWHLSAVGLLAAASWLGAPRLFRWIGPAAA